MAKHADLHELPRHDHSLPTSSRRTRTAYKGDKGCVPQHRSSRSEGLHISVGALLSITAPGLQLLEQQHLPQ